ncbi:MAG: hypothetical protein IKS31_11960 [Clostridia bacterium]|nr:hypothetical protein [Clostridia bacterium]
MKRVPAILLALTLILTCAQALADFDLSYFDGKDDVFSVETEEEDGVVYTFVETQLTFANLSFEHAHESEKRYSYTRFDLLYAVGDGDPVCYPRLWVTYCADAFLNIDSVTFRVEGTDYTFSDLKASAIRTDDEKGCVEELPIVFGRNSLPFLGALEKITDRSADTRELSTVRITAVLHGDEDLTVQLSENFMLDFYLIIEDALLSTDGLSTIDKTDESPMRTEEVKTLPSWLNDDPDSGAADIPGDASDLTKQVEEGLLELFGLDP